MLRTLPAFLRPGAVVLLGFGGASFAPRARADAPPGSTASNSPPPPEAARERAATSPEETPWIRRYAPQANTVELGIWGGIFLPSPRHELFGPDVELPAQGYQPLAAISGAAGARATYLPARVLGLEVEGGIFPARTRGDQQALLWTTRGHVSLQLPRWSVVPFVIAGAGATGVRSPRAALGNDVDLTVHFGGGLKVYLQPRWALRLDLRDIVGARRGVDDGLAHSGEITVGLSLTLGRSQPRAARLRPDRDADGFVDRDDACPDSPGVAPDGCPLPDTDGDGFLDADDACPQSAGVAPDGCPIPDTDNDGVPDPQDACPEEPGPAPDGCPPKDSDDDGFLDTEDQCIDRPETRNGFEDEDGCPDEVPGEVEAYTGIIEGIFFESDQDSIRAVSRAKLDAAVDILRQFPSISIEISGHTDNRGDRAYNMELSANRADAVRAYLIEQGIAPDRIQTRGAGPDEPIDTNRTRRGRAKNRRIEFQILQ